MTQNEQYRNAVAEHRAKHGQRETLRIIKQVAGVDDLWSVPEGKQRDVIEALKEPEGPFAGVRAFTNPDKSLNTEAIYARWNASGRGRARGEA